MYKKVAARKDVDRIFRFFEKFWHPGGSQNFGKIANIPNQRLLERPLRQKNMKNEVSEGGPILDPVLIPFLNGFWTKFHGFPEELRPLKTL